MSNFKQERIKVEGWKIGTKIHYTLNLLTVTVNLHSVVNPGANESLKVYTTTSVEGTKKVEPLTRVDVTETVPPGVLLVAVGSDQLTDTVSALFTSSSTSAGQPRTVGASMTGGEAESKNGITLGGTNCCKMNGKNVTYNILLLGTFPEGNHHSGFSRTVLSLAKYATVATVVFLWFYLVFLWCQSLSI